jgi:hypothetical protein
MEAGGLDFMLDLWDKKYIFILIVWIHLKLHITYICYLFVLYNKMNNKCFWSSKLGFSPGFYKLIKKTARCRYISPTVFWTMETQVSSVHLGSANPALHYALKNAWRAKSWPSPTVIVQKMAPSSLSSIAGPRFFTLAWELVPKPLDVGELVVLRMSSSSSVHNC